MTKGTGIYGAYKNAKPITEDFGDILLDHEQIGFQHREEDRIVEDRKDAKDKGLRQRIVKTKKALRPDYTGIKSEDQKRGELILKGSDLLNEAHIALEKNPNDIEASLKLSNLEDLPIRFKQMTERYLGWSEDGMTGLADGTYSEYLNRENLDKVDAVINGQVKYGLDNKGNVIGSYDKDGDGKPDFTWDGMATGVDLPEYKARFDTDSFMATAKARYGTLHTKNEDGSYETTEIKELSPDARLSIAQEIEDSFGANMEVITDDGLSYIADTLGIDPETVKETEFETIKEQFLLQNASMWDRKEFNTKNWQDENADQRNALGWAKLDDKKNEATPEQNEADFLKTLVDGTITGDSKAVGSWIGRVIGKDSKKKDVQIVDSEYTGKRLVFELSNGNEKVINLTDKHKAIGELTSMSNVKKQPQDLMRSYETGNVMRTLNNGEKNKYSRILFGKALSNIDTDDGNQVKRLLKEMGIEADNGNWFADNETINIKYKGKKHKFDVATDKGRKSLEEFVIDYGKTEEKNINTPKRKTIKASEIETKAKASGYTPEEYRELLSKKGVSIEEENKTDTNNDPLGLGIKFN